MPVYVYGVKDGYENSYEQHWNEYSDDELEAAWNTEDQCHKQSVGRKRKCHVIKCSKSEAIQLSRLFVRNVYAGPTCCNFDGETLSLYCGESCNWKATLNRAKELIPDSSVAEKIMPVKIHKIANGKVQVSTPSGVKSKATTPEKAKAQARLLNAIEHGFKPTGKKK